MKGQKVWQTSSLKSVLQWKRWNDVSIATVRAN